MLHWTAVPALLLPILFAVPVRAQAAKEAKERPLTELIDDLGDPVAGVRLRAATALQKAGAKALPALIAALKDDDPRFRAAVLDVLGRIGADAGEAVPAVVEQLKGADPAVRTAAAAALGKIGPAAKAGVPALVESLKDRGWAGRRIAVEAVGRIGADAAAAVEPLVGLAKAGAPELRISSVEALGRIGPAAKSSVPVLVECLKHRDEDLRRVAGVALGMVGPDGVAALLKALSEGDEMLSNAAEAGLVEAGKAVVPILIETAKASKDVKVRQPVLDVLGLIGPEAEAAVPLLIEALKDEAEELRSSGAKGLGHIGAKAKAGVPALAATLKDGSATVRAQAAGALLLIGPESKEAVPALAAALKDANADVRRFAVGALGAIGRPHVADVIPMIRMLVKDVDARVGETAEAVLKKLGG